MTDAVVADNAVTGSDQAERNTEIVLTAMRELFAEKDLTALDRYWAEPYVQHSPQLPDGLDTLRSAVPGLNGYRTSPCPSRRPAAIPWCEPVHVASRNERTTAMNDQNQQEITVRDNPDKSRFDILVDDAHAGFSMYKDRETASARQRIFYHTVVFDQFEGRGLAGILTRTALSTSIQAGRRIVAVCPYVKKWLSTHHDFDDATDPVGPEQLRALR